MSNLPISSPYRSQPDKPITEAEREELGRQLNDAFAKGKVDQDDYRRLLDTVFSARTKGELLPVAEVLPVKATHQQPDIVAQQSTTAPGELAEARPAGRLALYGGIGIGVFGLLVVLLLVLMLL